jgi:hypothetical protein
MDYSCYVTIDNSNGKSTLNLTPPPTNKRSHYVVSPPQQIIPGQKIKFWLQDYAGIFGSEGSVTYSGGGQSLTFTYTCPTGWRDNKCSGADFYTSNDGVKWSKLNEPTPKGHPFFVRFVL